LLSIAGVHVLRAFGILVLLLCVFLFVRGVFHSQFLPQRFFSVYGFLTLAMEFGGLPPICRQWGGGSAK
jgi:hypothetical protein